MVYPGISGSTESSVSVSLFLLTDNWGSETTWELRNENGQIVETGPPELLKQNVHSRYNEMLDADSMGAA